MRSTRCADKMNGSTFQKFFFYKENWAIFSQLQAFECAGHGWMARVRTRWMAICRWQFYFTEATTHAPLLPNILGNFLAEHLDEFSGGRMFTLEKANNSLHPIAIGSFWCQCTARLEVAEVRNNVQLSLCHNFRISLCARQRGATR